MINSPVLIKEVGWLQQAYRVFVISQWAVCNQLIGCLQTAHFFYAVKVLNLLGESN